MSTNVILNGITHSVPGTYSNSSGTITTNNSISTINSAPSGTFTIANSPFYGMTTMNTRAILIGSASFIRQCFPANWNISKVSVTSDNGVSVILLEVDNGFNQDDMHEFWKSKIYSNQSIWEASKETTRITFNVYAPDKETIKNIHKEIFDSQFIKDFEES